MRHARRSWVLMRLCAYGFNGKGVLLAQVTVSASVARVGVATVWFLD